MGRETLTEFMRASDKSPQIWRHFRRYRYQRGRKEPLPGLTLTNGRTETLDLDMAGPPTWSPLGTEAVNATEGGNLAR